MCYCTINLKYFLVWYLEFEYFNIYNVSYNQHGTSSMQQLQHTTQMNRSIEYIEMFHSFFYFSFNINLISNARLLFRFVFITMSLVIHFVHSISFALIFHLGTFFYSLFFETITVIKRILSRLYHFCFLLYFEESHYSIHPIWFAFIFFLFWNSRKNSSTILNLKPQNMQIKLWIV